MTVALTNLLLQLRPVTLLHIRSAHAYVAACRHALQLTRAFQRTFTKILQVIFARERSRGVPRAFEGDMCFYSCVIDFGSQLSG